LLSMFTIESLPPSLREPLRTAQAIADSRLKAGRVGSVAALQCMSPGTVRAPGAIEVYSQPSMTVASLGGSSTTVLCNLSLGQMDSEDRRSCDYSSLMAVVKPPEPAVQLAAMSLAIADAFVFGSACGLPLGAIRALLGLGAAYSSGDLSAIFTQDAVAYLTDEIAAAILEPDVLQTIDPERVRGALSRALSNRFHCTTFRVNGEFVQAYKLRGTPPGALRAYVEKAVGSEAFPHRVAHCLEALCQGVGAGIAGSYQASAKKYGMTWVVSELIQGLSQSLWHNLSAQGRNAMEEVVDVLERLSGRPFCPVYPCQVAVTHGSRSQISGGEVQAILAKGGSVCSARSALGGELPDHRVIAEVEGKAVYRLYRSDRSDGLEGYNIFSPVDAVPTPCGLVTIVAIFLKDSRLPRHPGFLTRGPEDRVGPGVKGPLAGFLSLTAKTREGLVQIIPYCRKSTAVVTLALEGEDSKGPFTVVLHGQIQKVRAALTDASQWFGSLCELATAGIDRVKHVVGPARRFFRNSQTPRSADLVALPGHRGDLVQGACPTSSGTIAVRARCELANLMNSLTPSDSKTKDPWSR